MQNKLKIHTTNYFETFIEVAEDTKVVNGTKPISKRDKKSVAEMQFDLINKHPYTYTSDDILFHVYAEKNDVTKNEYQQAREAFFSKRQPCLCASPLTKTYGFGIHFDSKGKAALYGMETEDYQKFLEDEKIKKVKAMRTHKK
ncbi:MAG: DUF6157 family protein [Ginsengibacter sp.]